MLIPNSLLVNAHTGDSKDAILFLQPARVELAIWYDPEENQAQDYR
jgi:hypothetical protein